MALELEFRDWSEIYMQDILQMCGIEPEQIDFDFYTFNSNENKPINIILKNGLIKRCNYENLGSVKKHGTKMSFDAITTEIDGRKKGIAIYLENTNNPNEKKLYKPEQKIWKEPSDKEISLYDFFSELKNRISV